MKPVKLLPPVFAVLEVAQDDQINTCHVDVNSSTYGNTMLLRLASPWSPGLGEGGMLGSSER